MVLTIMGGDTPFFPPQLQPQVFPAEDPCVPCLSSALTGFSDQGEFYFAASTSLNSRKLLPFFAQLEALSIPTPGFESQRPSCKRIQMWISLHPPAARAIPRSWWKSVASFLGLLDGGGFV